MKKRFLVFLSAVFAVALFLFPNKAISAKAEESDAYRYDIESYDVVMTLRRNHTIDVVETIEASFSGYASHGIIRDLAVNNGERITGIRASCDHPDFSVRTVQEEDGYLSVYLRGNGVVTGERRVYTLSYTLSVPNQRNADAVALDIIPYGWSVPLHRVTATLVPEEAIRSAMLAYEVVSGRIGSDSNPYAEVSVQDGAILMTAELLPSQNGITIETRYAEGTLRARPAANGLLAALITMGVLLFLVAALSLTAFRKQEIIPVVTFTAPDDMDPLQVGKYIDNSVDAEDITSLVYYFADKGYLAIDLSDENDPILTKTVSALPASVPAHQAVFFNELFASSDRVPVSSLRNRFYKTAQSVKSIVSASVRGLFRIKSYLCTALIALLAAGAYIVEELLRFRLIGGKFFEFVPLLLLGPTLLGYLFGARSFELSYKKKRGWIPLLLLSLLAGGIFGIFHAYGISFAAHMVASVTLSVVGFVCGRMILRTKEYDAILGQLTGFKNFILYTEKDKIKFMLENDPQLYYHILPYAQVLGVTKEWTDRFADLTIEPPAWAQGYGSNVFDFMLLNAMLHRVTSNLSSAMLSRPSGGGGGISGGGGGLSGGGGFGGGGGRGC